MNVGLAVPDGLHVPIGRGRQDRIIGGIGCLRVEDRQFDLARRVLHRIDDRHEIGAELGRPVDQAVGVDGRIAPIGRDLVMQIRLGCRPVPQRDDDVAFDALRPRRLGRRQLAGGDAIGPLAEQLQRALRVEPADVRGHIGAGLT